MKKRCGRLIVSCRKYSSSVAPAAVSNEVDGYLSSDIPHCDQAHELIRRTDVMIVDLDDKPERA